MKSKISETQICNKYNGGINTVILAKEYGVVPSTISRILKNNGVILRNMADCNRIRYALDNSVSKEIIQMYTNGSSISKIIKNTNIGYRRIKKH